MKLSRKRNLLLSFAGVLLLGSGIGIGFGSGKTVNQNKINSLNHQINELNLQFQRYSLANKEDKSKIQKLQSQSKNLQFLVQNLQESNLSSENLDDFLSKVNQQKISEDEYKVFEKPLQNWKSNLVKKVSALTKTLKNFLNKNNNLTEETQQGITESLNKAKNLLNSLDQITFNDTKSAVNAFKLIQKSQNIFLNQLNTSISLIVGQINKHNQEVNTLKEQIGQRDEKIKELAEKLASQLRFYLKLIKQFKKSLQDFNDFDFEQFGSDQSEKIKDKISNTLKLIKTKETIFSELLDQMNDSLADAQDNNDYSDVQSYDLNVVQNSFEKITKGYDLIRNALIPLYTKWNQEKGLEIVNQAKQISDLENQIQTFQAQIDSLNTQKTTLEEDFLSTKTELENTKSELAEQQQKLSNNEKALDNINTELAQTKNSLESTQESLRNTQAQLVALNSELDSNNLQVESIFDSIKTVYMNLKDKANLLLGEINNSIDVSQLRSKLNEQLVVFNESASTEEKLASIKNLIQKSTELSNLYSEVAQKDFDFKTQKSNEQINALQLQNQAIETQIQELQAKQARFSSVLFNNITTLTNTYASRKVEAQKIVEKAKVLNISTTEIEELLALEDLQATGSDLNAQINFVEQYINRISELSSKLLELQNTILDKTTAQSDQAKKGLKKLEKQKVKLDKEKKLLDTKLKQEKQTSETLRQTIQQKDTEINNLRNRADTAERDSNFIKSLSQRLQKEKDQAIQDRDQARREKEQIQELVNNQKIEFNSQINSLKETNSNLEKDKNELKITKGQLEQEKTHLENQLNEKNIKLKETIADYTKYKNIILNSIVYKNAISDSSNYNWKTHEYDPWANLAYITPLTAPLAVLGNYTKNHNINATLTGYSDPGNDKQSYSSTFIKINPGKEPDRVIAVNKIKAIINWDEQEKAKLRYWYIDTTEPVESNQLKYFELDWTKDMIFKEKDKTWYTEIHNESNYDNSQIQSEYLITKSVSKEKNQVEFTNVIADYHKNKSTTNNSLSGLKAKTIIIGIEQIR
ncbi:hypothetical protein NPA08_01455 [Mycoplasmopsis citelli]|uniref:hypothetical protein n=1 Tax=Mycoplasmopsis citelli TaxID=171281 RepID=UPI002114CBF0|nr:hypothetical protein [Mycoplasmopsis citelli]UUD36483.1 hypothetical protein NPA08_01455 [Mycoplasmopsis citelli]